MDIPVLKYLDILIGLAVVMVIVSTVVLAITQTVLNTLRARPRHLERGLARLIEQLDPEGLRVHSRLIAALVLRHPVIGTSQFLKRFLREPYVPEVMEVRRRWPGSVIQREELTYLLVEFAAGEGPLVATVQHRPLLHTLDPEAPVADGPRDARPELPASVSAAQAALARALNGLGIEDPRGTVRALRLSALKNEKTHPDQPAHTWRNQAILECSETDYVARIYQSFDGAMARVTDSFGAETQVVVVAVALLVASTLQLDSFALIRRLSIHEV